jgi:hypothetical protein
MNGVVDRTGESAEDAQAADRETVFPATRKHRARRPEDALPPATLAFYL